MTGRRLTGASLSGVVLTIAGAASVTVCLASASGGFRDVIQTDGGFCASGGPYAIGNQCSAGPGGLAYYGPREVAHLGARALVRTGAGRIGMWLIGSVAGTGLGLAATSGLIGVLR
jgi:hypothetical protein